MNFIVYGSNAGMLLLVPDCFLPSFAAQSSYGPLDLCGKVRDRAGGAELWNRFCTDIERQSFAIVSVGEADTLLGHEHPCLQHFRRHHGLAA
jgi:hypothetical protein